MATDVVMPQMGESVAEGTIVRWLKRVGDAVERDEPLFEISTDKVDAEIPSPVAGVITEIRHKEGETVEINTIVAVIGAAGTQAAAPPAVAAPKPAPVAPPPPAPVAAAPKAAAPPPPHYHAVHDIPDVVEAPAAPAYTPAPPSPRMMPSTYTAAAAAAPAMAPHASSAPASALLHRSSPLVRRIAKEHNVDISTIAGSGISGRVTKNDILAYLGGAGASRPAPAVVRVPAPAPARPAAAASTPAPATPAAAKPATTGVAAGVGMAGQTVPMSVMRKRIAEHMINSRRTSAHVHSIFEVNFHVVDQIRKAKKAEYEAQGAKLTYLSFIIKAAAEALKAVPVINASLVGDNVVYHKDINIGIAVALDWGLIVPVIKNADQKSLLEISKTVVDLANRARAKQLKPDEVAGGTFTITNPGTFGASLGLPIINQPQLAIVSIGAIQKRVVVVDDAIAIRPMALFGIGFDHRIIDGAVADEWLAHVARTLEHWDPKNV